MAGSSNVWFIPVDNGTDLPVLGGQLSALLAASGFEAFITPATAARIKLHFGEVDNTGFIRPELIRVIADAIIRRGGTAVLSDTNTLYRGQRTQCSDHTTLALAHGFTQKATGATLHIPDDNDESAAIKIAVNGHHCSTASVMRCFIDADLLIGAAHFKGHMMTGFGGALKNIGMGCATREGKLAQHCSVAPFIVKRNCIGCGDCAAVCPVDAITIVAGKAELAASTCIGCASCIAACRHEAVELDWGSGAISIIEKMVEYTEAVLKGRTRKFFVNVATHITAECDCLAKDDPSIVPDIGIFASADPVALDQACYDAACVKAGGFDPFKKAHPGRNPLVQLDYAEQRGIGSRSYALIRVPVAK